MAKWIIKWDAGFGEDVDVFEADTHEEAVKEAYEQWKETAESNAMYSAEPYTKEEAINYGLEDESET